MKNWKTILWISTCVALITGCSTVSVQTRLDPAAPGYPPTEPSTIQVLRVPPVGAHVRLGEITVQLEGNPSKESVRAKVRAVAANLGANAVVIVSDRQELLGSYATGAWWGKSVATESERVIVVVAIHYLP